MKLYAISGLGADQRVFEGLDMHADLVPLHWVKPLKNESIESYAIRLSEGIDTNEKFGLIGVSFGGMVATEVVKHLNPEVTILISSTDTKNGLKWYYRTLGKSRLLSFLPKSLFNPPKWLAHWLFGAQNKALLSSIIEDTDLDFAKWAAIQITKWENSTPLTSNVIKISGELDRLIKPTKDKTTIIVKGGHHFMVVDKADEISQIINQCLSQLDYTLSIPLAKNE